MNNIKLLKLAEQHQSYWEGVGIGALIDSDVERKDYTSLNKHLIESAKIIFDLEYHPEPIDLSENDIDRIGLDNIIISRI